MDSAKLLQALAGEPQFRIKQAKQALGRDLIDDWQEAKTLPEPLRRRLNQECPLALDSSFFVGRDSFKAVLRLTDGLSVETVLIKHRDGRQTACLSSQVGCALGCAFCATGSLGFKRNLTAGEILDQVLLLARHLKKTRQGKISQVVLMGMGEPLLNYEAVKEALKWLNDKDMFGLGWRHMSLSTAGIAPAIRNFTKDFPQVNLAVSLHAPTDELRSQLMPINRRYNLQQLFKAVDAHIRATSRQVMFEYTLLKGVNDSPAQARALAKLMDKSLYVLNLIYYNPTGAFQPSGREVFDDFYLTLKKAGIKVTKRFSPGQDIAAACGQLIGRPFA